MRWSNTDTYGNGNGNSHTYGDPNCDTYEYAYEYAYGHTHGNGYGDTDGNTVFIGIRKYQHLSFQQWDRRRIPAVNADLVRVTSDLV